MAYTQNKLKLTPTFFDKHLKVDINLKGVASENKFANEGAIGAAVYFNPTAPVYSDSKRYNGYWEWLDPNTTTGLKALAPLNPLGLLLQQDNSSNVQRSVGNIVIDYKLHFFQKTQSKHLF